MTAPAHYNPDPMFGLRTPLPNAALIRGGVLVGYVTVNWERLMTPLRDDDLIVYANSDGAVL